MTSAWSIFLTVLPYLMQLLGVWMGYQGIQNQHLAKTVQVSPTVANVYGPGQLGTGIALFVGGLGIQAYQHHKAVAVPVNPAPVPLPSPPSPNNPDPTTQTLLQLEKQISDDRDAKLAARKAQADADAAAITQKAAAEISLLRQIADSRKSG